MKNKYLVLIGLLAMVNLQQAQVFSGSSSSINDYWFPSSDWADIDNDGDMDLVISGALDTNNSGSPDTSKINFYDNVNGTLTLITQANVSDLHLGSVKFIDVDNDGDQDLVTSGQNYNDILTYFLTVYENDAGTFVVSQQLEGTIFSSIDIGDYDNDGDLDLLVSGAYQATGGASVYTRIYENSNGSFSDASAGLPGVQNGNVLFADVDKDSDLDIIVNGYDNLGDNFGALYTNNNGTFSQGSFPFNTAESWIAMGDYNNDGDIDLAYVGYNDSFDYVTKIYNNNGSGVFTDSGITLEGVGNFSGNNSIAWGDYDNDGDLDLVFAGTDNNFDDKTYLYANNGSSFSLVSEGLIDLGSYANLSFLDFDADNDLDFLISGGSDADGFVGRTRFFENTITVVNTKPNAPANLAAQVNSDDSITFTWDSPTDDFTPSLGLHYLITVGTTANASDIASYKVYGTSWTIKDLGSTNYFWSVNAIDTAFIMSDSATSETLSTSNFESQNQIRIYPNPTSDRMVYVSMNDSMNSLDDGMVEIYSLTGKKVFEQSLEDSNFKSNREINLSLLQSGIYVLNLKTAEHTFTKKIVLH